MQRDIETLRGVSQSPAVKAAITEQEAKLDKLKAIPHEPDRIVWVPTGHTVREHWETLDYEGRGKFLRDWRVLAYADRQEMVISDLGAMTTSRGRTPS